MQQGDRGLSGRCGVRTNPKVWMAQSPEVLSTESSCSLTSHVFAQVLVRRINTHAHVLCLDGKHQYAGTLALPQKVCSDDTRARLAAPQGP